MTGCLHTFVRLGYYGGRVEVFREKFETDGAGDLGSQVLNYGDVNSMYPWAMLGDVPIELAFVKDGHIDIERASRSHLGFVACTVNIPTDCYLPPLPYRPDRDKGKLTFPVGRFSGVWATEELALLGRCGGRVEKVTRSVWFRGGPLFRTYVEHWYKLRDKKRADYDVAMDLIAKLFLNSLYGKMGMISERERLWFFPTDEDFTEHKLVPIADAFFGAYKETTVSDPPYVIPHIAAWVTARSRARLWSLMFDMLARGYRIYYCDTDSIITDAPISDSPALGDLKTVCQIRRGLFVAPKMYFLEQADGERFIKAKGFSGGFGAKGLSEAEFMSIVKHKSKVTIRRMRKMREGMRSGERFPAMKVGDKGLRSGILDTKRIHMPDGNTQPIRVMEIDQ